MKLLVETNWQDQLIPKIIRKNVNELYGKLATDFTVGARFSFCLPHVSESRIDKHIIKEAHKYGLKFNYLLNAVCLDNIEYSAKGHRRLHILLDWLREIGVDSVTVTIPYLAELIKRQYALNFEKCPQFFRIYQWKT